MQSTAMTRRNFVSASALALGGLALAGCGGTHEAAPAEEQASDTPSEQPKESATQGKSDKVLVACFSATGNTRAVAKLLSAHLGADYLEIEPAEPYTEADLGYEDDARATSEQNAPETRPALAAVPDISGYEAILLGHPIWWDKAPRLICTLLESVDLSGKTLAEFCTSGGSGIDNAAEELQGLAASATWIGTQRFAAGAPEAEVHEWIDSLELS